MLSRLWHKKKKGFKQGNEFLTYSFGLDNDQSALYVRISTNCSCHQLWNPHLGLKSSSSTVCNFPTYIFYLQDLNMVVVADVIVTKIIEKLVELGFNYVADQYFARSARMKDEFERLNDALPRIQAIVEVVESGQH
ncbi:uncharacterized protein A4U43_C03F10090 [Asparagus officinalis]|uniref:Uncharacterized protein n=1 Tax=Asparagus officinalis TaxID=4686 RepID=A0A5P1F9E5_ASPOF|nr:uncharacterized protein A4U43_C03F10090 [Asparagus officinalis]